MGKKYNRRTLFRVKQFYNIFSSGKVSPLATQLTWSHYIELLPIKDENELEYYLTISINQNLSRNDLRSKIKSKEYQRLNNSTKNKFRTKVEIGIGEFVPNPILIRNKYNVKVINEKMLHQLILENISSFMKELGSGYSFIDSEYRIKLDDRYNFIDLLLYNIKYKCYIVIELKVTELKSEHTGQIQKYMNYIDKNIKSIEENDTIGIIICKKDNRYVIEYCSDDRIVARKYELV